MKARRRSRTCAHGTKQYVYTWHFNRYTANDFRNWRLGDSRGASRLGAPRLFRAPRASGASAPRPTLLLLWSAVAATARHCCLCCAAVAISRARAVVDAITEVYCCFAVMAWDVVAKQLWCTKLHWTIAFAFWMQYGIVLIHPQRLFVLHDLHSILRNSFWSSLGNHRLVSNTLQRICCPG